MTHGSSAGAHIDHLYDAVQQKDSQIDVVYANAGGSEFAPLGAITEEQFDKTFGTNVKGVLFTVQKALPLLTDGGAIVMTGSTTSIMGTAAFSVHSATKAAIRNFARSWILDLKNRGIRVNVISPGPVRTPGLVGLAGDDAAQQQGLLDYMATQVLLGRVGELEEIAKAVLSSPQMRRASSTASSSASTAGRRRSNWDRARYLSANPAPIGAAVHQSNLGGGDASAHRG